jgi:signal transduction histidine kinase
MRSLCVLLVDDDNLFLSQTKEALSKDRYSVTAVDDFDEAMEHLRRLKGRTIVLSELNVGKKSGLSFLQDALRQFPDLPFTFLATSPSLESVIEALKQGAYDFLRKPVDREILRHSVARSIEKLNLSMETEKIGRETEEQLARLQAELKKSRRQNAYKGFLISMAGHDFKSILTVLDGNFQIFKERCVDCARIDLAPIRDQAFRTITRLRTMSNTLLDYEAAERGELLVEKKEFRIDKLLQECASFYRPYAQQKRVAITLEEDLPRLSAKGDPDRVFQVLDNLLYNAIKFTPPKGEIRLGARPDGEGFAMVWIHDTGLGIPKSQLETIFADSQIIARQDPNARMGLGLSICRKLLAMQNGKIWLESEPGKGTKVIFSLPL